MKVKFYSILLGLLLSVGSNLPLLAQEEETTFDPATPAEPYVLYRVKVAADPVQAVSSLSGSGDYALGKSVTIRANPYSEAYTLTHWTRNGEVYETAGTKTSFSYTVTAEDAEFVACYTYNPELPSEPQSSNEWRMYLLSEPLDGGYFSISSGEKHEYDTGVDVTATPNTGYDFVGWYNSDGTFVSSNPSITYQMPNGHVTLTAKFEYNPVTPSEPGWTEDNQQDNVQQYAPGDADADGELSVNDIVLIINFILSDEYNGKADADEDGSLSVNDIVTIVNQILGKSE